MRTLLFFLELALTGSLLFLLARLSWPFAQRYLSAAWYYGVLIAALLAFLLPVAQWVRPPQIMRFYSAPALTQAASEPQAVRPVVQPRAESGQTAQQQAPANTDTVSAAAPRRQSKPDGFTLPLLPSAAILWLGGALFFLCRKIRRSVRFFQRFRRVSEPVEDAETLAVFGQCKQALHMKRQILLKRCAGLPSPMLSGLLRPAVTLPDRQFDKDSLWMIFSHELLHYRRGDLWVKLLGAAVTCIFWWNPFAWLLNRELDRACELSLDERLVKEMDKEKKRRYSAVILEMAEYSQSLPLGLSTAMCEGKSEVERRLKRIMYYKKTRKAISAIGLAAAMAAASLSVFAANGAVAPLLMQTESRAAFVGSDGLYLTELSGGALTRADAGGQITTPLFSKDGGYLAYVKEDALFVCDTAHLKAVKVDGRAGGYDWNGDGLLVYSSIEQPGLRTYDPRTGNQKELGGSRNYYENINCGAANAVYAQKWQKWEEGDSNYGFNAGVVRLDLDSGEETVLVEGRRSGEEKIGYNPTIAKVSEDGRYVYIWRKPSSGSLSSDGVPFGAYDTQNDVWIECGTRGDMFSGDVDYEGIYDNTGDFAGPFGLAYRNGVAPNPKDGSQVAVNAGGDRMMYQNKFIVLTDLESNTTTRLSPEGQVTMTPSFSKDGKSVLYSATAEIDDSLEVYMQNSANLFEDWFRAPHSIYRVETATGKVTQVTDSGRFDFLPQELADGSILFVRTDGKRFKLMKIKNGRETVLAEDLDFENEYARSGFYGHFKSERILDII